MANENEGMVGFCPNGFNCQSFINFSIISSFLFCHGNLPFTNFRFQPLLYLAKLEIHSVFECLDVRQCGTCIDHSGIKVRSDQYAANSLVREIHLAKASDIAK